MTDTPARLLNLLSLLQTPREWPGSELAERLGVTTRTIRRDVERLRDLGYPVQATMGAIGGYRLAAGAAMPPLVLDDEEAVAIAVGLRAGAGHAVEGIEEASVRALAKLEQVLPSRLRHRVAALQAATVPLTRGDGATVDPRTLTVMAAAATGQERLRFAYRKGDGTETQRLVEPHRLVSTGRRWYLVAYDIDRDDWRTFRVDRVSEPFATGARFVQRELPAADAAEFMSRSLARLQPTYRVVVDVEAPAAFVAARLPRAIGTPAPVDDRRCRLDITTADSLEWVAFRLALLDCEFRVHEPRELIEHLGELGARISRAASAGTGSTGA
ncbi:WYL domain-containing protein [Streptomyces sp. HU2014]|uniref:Transcriptional regulator n=1 Tax=Streptomyces albireticuli TaxID=1940 RepID=A0A1Z2L5P5_9ACTN|nr:MULTISPECIES: WYL domain-containing protein [Streptomyces]ARZ69606.1 transcriptional regulator [Streptomyces albireticuli]UQI43228.1 WYL domain-containing protein [Streptomyces sp. HU2014]